MNRIKTFILAFLLLFSAVAVAGELPRVLFIGDMIRRSIAPAAAKELADRAEIVVPKAYPGDTGTALTRLDELLGDGKWDLIQFNFGFVDLRYIDPKTKSIRVMSKHAGGIRTSTPEQYEKNLRDIVRRLKETEAKLVWTNTTPLESSKYETIYDLGSEIEYNSIAAKIMRENGIPVLDMHAWVLKNVEKRGDSFSYKKIPIHEPIVASIEETLKLPKKK